VNFDYKNAEQMEMMMAIEIFDEKEDRSTAQHSAKGRPASLT
jgi:hypothetical protein